MRPMAAIERLLERAFERSTARLFRLHLRPVQVLRRVERAMEEGRRRRGTGFVVPNRFAVALHPSDLADDPAGLESLAAELADGALAFARRRRYALLARTHVKVARDPAVEPGEVRVVATFDAAADPTGVEPEPDAFAGTRAFAVPDTQPPVLVLHGSHKGRPIPDIRVDGTPVTIGRDRSCEVVLRDPAASRRHARLQARQGTILLVDLDSTNGTWVNERRIRETALGAGDRVVIGETAFEVEVPDEPGAG